MKNSADGRDDDAIKGLGEVVLRVKDLDKMQAFYPRVVGLELLQRFGDTHAFLKIADGYGGHTQIVALFAESVAPQLEFLSRASTSVDRTTLHHFALEIPLEQYRAQKDRLEGLGLAVRLLHRQKQPALGSPLALENLFLADAHRLAPPPLLARRGNVLPRNARRGALRIPRRENQVIA